MSDTPGNENAPQENELAEDAGFRYNLDSLDDYIVTTEEVAREGRLDEAVDVMREGVKRYPDSATGQYNLGVALFLRVKKDRDHLVLWENLADDDQLAEEAINALEAAVETDPSFVQALNNLATLYALRGRKQEALDAWNRSLKLDSNQPEVRADMEMYCSGISPRDEDLETRELLDESERPDNKL
jgi:tetratricopeptide (TPR) repeat protein